MDWRGDLKWLNVLYIVVQDGEYVQPFLLFCQMDTRQNVPISRLFHILLLYLFIKVRTKWSARVVHC